MSLQAFLLSFLLLTTSPCWKQSNSSNGNTVTISAQLVWSPCAQTTATSTLTFPEDSTESKNRFIPPTIRKEHRRVAAHQNSRENRTHCRRASAVGYFSPGGTQTTAQLVKAYQAREVEGAPLVKPIAPIILRVRLHRQRLLKHFY